MRADRGPELPVHIVSRCTIDPAGSQITIGCLAVDPGSDRLAVGGAIQAHGDGLELADPPLLGDLDVVR